MKNMSSRIWLSSWSCRWWDHAGARRALSPGLGVFNTRWRDGCGCPFVGLGAETGDMMSNNSTTENSMLALKKKKTKHFEECLRLFAWWQHERRSFFDVIKILLQWVSTELKPTGHPGSKTKFLAGARKPRKWEALALWIRNEGMCSRIITAKTGQIRLIEIQSLSLTGLINYSAYTRVGNGRSTHKTWIL